MPRIRKALRVVAVPFALLAAAACLAGGACAQEADPLAPGPWKFGATVGVNLSQSTYSNNWAGGDRGSIVWVLQSNSTAQRQFSRSFNLSNVLQIAYGQTSRQVPDPEQSGQLTWDRPEKSTDQIAFESTGRFTLQRFFDPYLSFHLDTQFRDQSYAFTDIKFNPIKLKETAGLARVLEKTDDREAITRLGFGFRQTIAKSIVDPVTLAQERFTSNDGGLEWQTTVVRPLLDKRIIYKGSLLVFEPLFYSKSSALDRYDLEARAADPTHRDVADFWRSPDVNFQNAFTAQITKLLSVNLYVQWIYDKFDAAANVDNALALTALKAEIDKNVRRAGQFKETLAIGITYQVL